MNIGIIFDMDGVLVESEQFYFKRRLAFLDKKKVKPGSAKLTDHVGKTDLGIWQTLVPQDEQLRHDLRQEYLVYRETKPIDYQAALRPGVPQLLKILKQKDFKIGLASSSARKEIDRMLEENQLADYFDYVISGEDLAESKPNPEIYLLSKQALACEEYIAVEDSTLGIKASKAAEIFTVALVQDFPVDQEEADYVIQDLQELLELPQVAKALSPI